MAKTPKLLILSFLMLITLSISVSAINITSEGTYTTQDTVYRVDYINDNEYFAYRNVQPSLKFMDENGDNIYTSTTSGAISLGTASLTGDQKYINDEIWIGESVDSGNTLFWVVYELNGSFKENIIIPFVYGTTWDTAYDGTYVYTLPKDNEFIDRFSNNGIWLDRTNITSEIINPISLTALPNGTFLITDATTIYEVSSDFQTVYSSVTNPNIGVGMDYIRLHKTQTENIQIIISARQTSTNSFSVYNLTDTYSSPYFLITGDNYSKQLCIDSNTYCSDTSYILNIFGEIEFSCNSISNVESCSDTCINVEIDNVIVGQCSQLGCTNECNIIGQTSCTSGSTYATCGNFDSDACLEFGSVLNCPANQYCSDEEVGSQCSTLTTNTLYNQDFLSVDLDLLSQSGVIKEEGTSEKTKNIAEIGLGYVMALYPPSYLLGFDNVKTYVLESFYKDQINETYVMSSFEGTGASTNYYAYNCDYEQNYFLSDNLEHNDLNSNGWIGSGVINTTEQFNFIETTGTINKTIQEKTNSETDVIIELLETGTYNVKYYNDENLLLDFEIVNNKTNFNILVTEKQNNKLLLNSTSTSDDLQEIFIRTSFINDVEAGNNFISLIRNVLGQDINENYFSLPLGVGNSLNPNKIVFESNTNQLWIYEVIGSSIKDYPVYTNDEESIKNFECQHNQAECYIVRAYGNTQGMSTYYFYEEIQTCIQSLNGVVSVTTPDVVTSDERSTIEKVLNKTWNTKQKLLFAVITLIIVFGLFGALTMADGDKTFMLIGTILTGVLMFYFIIDGFIPAWVIVLFGIVGAFISASAIRNMSTGA